jgi:hypothetical protein
MTFPRVWKGGSNEATVMDGDAARFVMTPIAVDLCCVNHVCDPAGPDAVAPGPPLALLPYVTVSVEPPISMRPDTAIV